ncbi:MAG: ABC transporter substrate-binding protein [Candidatus Binatia bacterium]|nr:ABC transporter substrate-binding protein [Candidatus Binatia bacterium]
MKQYRRKNDLRPGLWGLGVAFLMLTGQGVATESPLVTVRSAIEQAMAVLADPAYQGAEQFQARMRKLEAVVLPHLDTREFGRRCLGVHWQQLTEAQRQEFIELFKQLIEKSYGGMLDRYANGIRVTYERERIEENFAEVDTRIFSQVREQPFLVTYRLHQVAGRWLLYDVVVENVSMVSNYRNQFHRIISRSSYDELVAAMKRKLAQLDTAPQQTMPAS